MPCQWGCNAAITACALGIQWEKALLLLFEWQNLGKPRGRPRDVISFSAAITACQRLSKWQQAIHLLRTSLPDFKIAPHTLCFYGALWLPTKTIRDMWKMSWEMAVLMILQYSLDQDAPSQYHNQTLPFHVWLFEFRNVLKSNHNIPNWLPMLAGF